MANPAAPIQRDMTVPFQPIPDLPRGQGSQQFGDELTDFGVAQEKARQEKDLVAARLDATKQLDALSDQFRTDTDPDTMAQRYSNAADAIGKSVGAKLQGPSANAFADDFGMMSKSRLRSIKDIAFARQTEQANAALDDTIETATRAAAFSANPAERASNLATVQQGIDGLVNSGMLSASAGEKKLQVAKERLALFDGKRDVFLDPKSALANLGKPEFLPDLDPLSRIELMNSAESELRSREREARAAQAQARLEATQAASDLHDVIASGLPASQDVIDRAKASAIASGDPRALSRVAGLLRAQGFADALRGANPREVDAGIAQLTTEANRHGADEGMATALMAARKFKETMNGALSHDPLMWAQQQGVVNIAPLALNGTDAPAAFAARVKQAQAVSQRYGVPFQPLTQAESDNLKTKLAHDQDPNARLVLLQNLTRGLGANVMPVLGKIGATDPAIANAGALVASGAAYVGAARDVLTGSSLLSDKANSGLKPTDSAQAGADVPGLMAAYALLPDMRSAVLDGAAAIYAARAARQGKSADIHTSKGVLLYSQALQEAAGARFEADGTQWGGIGQYRRNSVLVPGNIKADDFEDIVHAMRGGDLAHASVNGQPPSFGGDDDVWNILKHTWLVSGGNGIYALSATDPSKGAITPVKDKSGQPFRFNFNTALVAMQARQHGGR